jgi:hypothetical protein
MDALTSIAQAIATMEGYFTSGTRADRKNNPDNPVSKPSDCIRKSHVPRWLSLEAWRVGGTGSEG